MSSSPAVSAIKTQQAAQLAQLSKKAESEEFCLGILREYCKQRADLESAYALVILINLIKINRV